MPNAPGVEAPPWSSSKPSVWPISASIPCLTLLLVFNYMLFAKAHADVLRKVSHMPHHHLVVSHPGAWVRQRPSTSRRLRVQSRSLFFTQVAWNLCNDCVRSTLCLQYHPLHLAHAAIYLASR